MGGVGGGGEPAPITLQAIAFCFFAAGNIGLNVFNSWALKVHDEDPTPSWKHPNFNFAVFYTMFHMLVSALAAILLLLTVAKPPAELGMPSFRQLWEYKHAMIPIAICTMLNNGLNNLSLTMVSLFVNQVIKATQPFFVIIFSYFIANKRYGYAVITTVLFMIAGSVLSNYHDMTSGSSSTSVPGVIICLVSLLANALRPVVAMMVMSGADGKPKLPPTSVLFYDCALAFIFMLIYWLISYERAGSVNYLSGSHGEGGIATVVILCGSTMAFTFNLANYSFIRLTSALTSGIGANTVKIFLIFLSALMNGVSDPVTWTGVAIVVVAILVYLYLNLQTKIHEALGIKSADAGGPSEATPLNAGQNIMALGESLKASTSEQSSK